MFLCVLFMRRVCGRNVIIGSLSMQRFNLRSGVPFVFVGSGKERLIQLLDYSSAAP